MDLYWNVFMYNSTTKKIVVENVFNHSNYKKDIEELIHNCTDNVYAFSEKVRSVSVYYFWSKCEYETVIYPWVGDDKCKRKVDVFWQLEMNWENFIEYLLKFKQDKEKERKE